MHRPTRLRRRRSALTVLGLAASALVWSGCEGAKQTELVAGVSTQMKVPRDIEIVRVVVDVGGVSRFDRVYKVYDGRVQLPRSLGSLPVDVSTSGDPITMMVAGYTSTELEALEDETFRLRPTVGRGDHAARILRRSRQGYVRDKILFLPMPLKFACQDKDCGDNVEQTCKGGRCVSASVDPNTLPEWREDLLDGKGSACFRMSECLAGAVAPVVVDADQCVYAVANTTSAPATPSYPVPVLGPGVNVLAVFDGGTVREVLDKDAEEGFTIPDPTKPQQFKLAPGLCDMMKGQGPDGPTAHRISSLLVSGLCQAKGPFQPLCEGDQLEQMGVDPQGIAKATPPPPPGCQVRELKASPSALLVLVDRTARMDKFYADQLVQATINLSLSDPAWERTQIGLTFYPAQPAGQCASPTNPYATPSIPLTPAVQARATIAQRFQELTADASKLLPANAELSLDRAFAADGAVGSLLALGPTAQWNRRAILLVGNHGWVSQCTNPGTPLDGLVSQAKTQGINTYAVVLGKEDAPDAEVAGRGQGIAVAGAPAGPTPQVFDARTDNAQGAIAFQRIVNDLATCVYDAPATGLPATTSQVRYANPLTGEAKIVAHNAGCVNEGSTTASGWGIDNGRIRLCGVACDELRATLAQSALFSAQQQKAAAAVPIFSTENCSGTP